MCTQPLTITILNTLRERHIREPICYLDNGYLRSMISVKSYLYKYVEQLGLKVVFGDNASCITKGYGSINCGGIIFSKQRIIFNANKEIVLIAPRRNDVYVFEMSSLAPNEACFFAKASESVNWLWHKRLSYLNFKNINKLSKQNKVLSLSSLVYSKDKPCSACEKGKHKRASFKTKQNFSIRKCLHLLHMDLFGHVSPMSINHEKYTLVIVDEYSRTDNRIKFRNSKLESFCDEKGISQNLSSPCTPKQNGVAERKNRTIIEATRTMLNGSDEQINQLIEESSGNNTKTSVPIIESLVPEVPQSQDTNHASTSSYPITQDRWSRDQHIELVNIISDPGEGMLTKSMAAKLTSTLASECLFAYFLSEIEPKKVFKNKKDEHGIVTKNKARLVPQGYSQEEGIDYDETFIPDDKGISICQEQHTRNLLKKYEISDSSSVKTLMVPPNYLGPDLAGKPVNETMYRGMIGSLMYLTATRPDIQFLTCLCARYQASPKESHLIVVKIIFRYLKEKSTSGAYQILGGKLVCCSAKKQQSLAMSSAKTKYVTVAGCYANILWIKIQLNDYDIHYKMVPIFCDNTSAIAISNNPVLHSRTKHIDIRYHFIKDHILKGDIKLHFISTKYQLADIFTKPLDKPTFTRLKVELGMLNID
ncbi:retrovirus-related pol polyprotein from transposon TNT 1-94 [Tanacetum coccineum]